ncbi:MAG: geranylgeranyl reductase family protein [Candidatus Heimdallarchaeota archaeon]
MTFKMKYDVVISGAGPAGSKCAEVIAKAGYKVALIEKDVNYRKPCGGGIPRGSIFEYYPQLRSLGLLAKNAIYMYSADYHKLEHTYEESRTSAIVIDRLEFDNLVRNVAIEAGAELFDTNISYDFEYKNKQKIGIKTKTPSGKKEYYGNIIIIADGMSSKLAYRSGLRGKWKPLDIGIGKAQILEGQTNLNERGTYFFFKDYGYNWIFPINNQRFNIGAITYHENNLKHNINVLYNDFLNDMRNRDLLLKNEYEVIWSASFPEPASGVLEKSLYDDNLLVIGDAAGFVAPISGEGIHGAIVSGQIAGETSINALEIDDFTKNTLKEFKKHSKIKKLIRTFRFQSKFVNFIYENAGENLNKAFKKSEESLEFKETMINSFIFGRTPPKNFISEIRNM